jgi:AAHS family benzoate transporter-like MFS transporter
MSASITTPRRSVAWVVGLCWAILIFDGYDLVMYGTVLPKLLHEPGWDLTKAGAGHIASWGLVGMLIGALSAGTFAHLVGNRRILLACTAWFSVLMGLSAFASSPEMLTVLRFLTGLGLGGVVPTASALTLDVASDRRRLLTFAGMFSGITAGNLIAAVVATQVVPNIGWRAMFLIGALPLVTVLPLAWWKLPESPVVERRESRGVHVRELFAGPRYTIATLLLWSTTFLGLVLIYAMSIWLPELMRENGYALGAALTFLVALDGGAVLSMLPAAAYAERRGLRVITPLGYLLATVTIALLATKPPTGLTYLLIVGAGAGVIGTQMLVNAYAGTFYPEHMRATGIGWSLGIGRTGAILGPTLTGAMLDAGFGVDVNFLVFAGIAAAAGVLIALMPARPHEQQPGPSRFVREEEPAVPRVHK